MSFNLDRWYDANTFSTNGIYTQEEVDAIRKDGRWPQNFGLISSGFTGISSKREIQPAILPVQGNLVDSRNCISMSFHTNLNGRLFVFDDGTLYRQLTTNNPLEQMPGSTGKSWIQATGHSLSASAMLAVASDNTLWAYGSNNNYLTLQGTTTGTLTTMTQCTGNGATSDWKQACVVGTSAVVALKTNGTIWSWGTNVGAYTGQGTATGTTTDATQIGTATNWVGLFTNTLSSGTYGVIALNSSGELYAWGLNTSGLTGQGTSSGTTLSPAKIGTATTWSKVYPTLQGFQAIQTDGTLWFWGLQQSNCLSTSTGNSTFTTPVKHGTDTDWAFVANGGSSQTIGWTLAQKTNGDVFMIGYSAYYPNSPAGSSGKVAKRQILTGWFPFKLALLGSASFYSY